MSPYSESSVPKQDGKTFFITGANTGLGFEASRVLAARGARVLMGCRSEDKAGAAIEQIRATSAAADLEWVPLDLTNLASVQEAAEKVATESRLDVLVNNAGVMIPPLTRTDDGFELQFGVNHLAHFALTGHLFDRLTATPGARVVTVTSLANREGEIDFEDPNAQQSYDPMSRYRMSKAANLHFTLELARRCEARGLGVTSVACHPGIADTELSRTFPSWFQLLSPVVRMFFNSPEEGALPTLLSATAPEVEGGSYYGPTKRRETARSAGAAEIVESFREESTARRLWDLSAELTGVSYLRD